jgi:hypothetical protein
MKRDMDLAREILEQVEEKSQGIGSVRLEIPDHSENEIGYHVMLLGEAGLLVAKELGDTGDTGWEGWVALKMTWEGHEFLDAIRNDTVWNKVKEVAKEKGGGLTFEVIKALALKFASSLFGLG